MFRQKDTLDMHVYSKNTSQKYTHVQVAKYLMKKKTTENKKDINNKGCLAKKQHACEKDNFQLFFERFY